VRLRVKSAEKGAIPDDERFASQLAAPGDHINPRSKLVIESKADMVKRGEASPDDGDALALDVCTTVAPPEIIRRRPQQMPRGEYSWMG
jgi:hypothetical protein